MTATKKVRDFMSERLICVGPEMDIHEAVKLLIREQISGVPVVDQQGALIGVLSEKDCFKVCFFCCYHQDRGGRVADHMTRSVVAVNIDDDIVGVAEMLLKGPYRRFPVVLDDRVVGVISRRDALKGLLELC